MTSTPLPPADSPLTRFTDAIWVGVPLVVRRFSGGLAAAAVDGLYLAARPIAGLLVPLGALWVGLIIGVFHPGFDYVFTESLTVLLIVAVVGVLSGGAGLYLTLGFAVGDLLLGDHPQWFSSGLFDIVPKYGSLLLTYFLFGLLAVGVPLAAKSFAAEFMLPPSVPRPLRALVGLGAFVIIAALLVFVWAQSAPLLVRPVFVWAGANPTVEAISSTQLHGGWLVAIAGLAAIGRSAAQFALASDMEGQTRMTLLENRFRTLERVVPLTSRIPLFVRLILRAALLTMLLSGLFGAEEDFLLVPKEFIGYAQALMTFVVLLIAQVIASPLVPFSMGGYGRFMNRIPRLIRLIAAMVPVLLLGGVVLNYFHEQRTTSFLPFLVLTILSAILMTLLSPTAKGVQK